MTIYHIYGIYNEDYPHTYIGYTKDIEERLKAHRQCAKTKNYKVYKYMREVQGKWKMEVLETHECSKKFAKERERYYKELMGDLNVKTPGRTKAEYYLDNREIKMEESRNWRENNRERHREQARNWCKNNQERVKANNDRQKLNRYTCACGSNLRWSDRLRHYRSDKHIAYKNKD